MNRKVCVLLLSLLVLPGLALFGLHQDPSPAEPPRQEAKSKPETRPVFLASGLSAEDMVALSANVAAASEKGVVLLDVPANRRYLKDFLAAHQPSELILVGSFADDAEKLERSLGRKVSATVDWKGAFPSALWKTLFARADQVVVCAAEPRPLLLHAACLAGTMRAPLYVLKDREGEGAEMRQQLAGWRTRVVHAVGEPAQRLCRAWPDGTVRSLPDVKSVTALARRLQAEPGPVQTLVVANPTDSRGKTMGMSTLAPWVAVRRRAALLLTGEKGDAADLIRQAAEEPGMGQVENLILVADLKAVPPERRPNPLPGKDEFIEIEPPGPRANEPFTFATGRLFDEDPGVVLMMLARQRLLTERTAPPRALIVSNPGGGLPLLETLSRNTAKELKNAGYQTRTFFHTEASPEALRRHLPEQEVFLWEGHRSTLERDYKVPGFPEPLSPSLVFLQSCLVLSETGAHPFLRRGAVAVVGSSSRTYSATGGAFTLACFDAMLYDEQTLGGAMRQARNFLLAYSRLKEARLGEAATQNGAAVRGAWAFTLWGDPTLKLPHPKPPPDALPAVRARVEGKRIIITLPEASYETVRVDRFEAKTMPNARLAGYVIKDPDREVSRLPPLLFAEVRLPPAPGGKPPVLKSKLPADRWVFLWDERRSAGYLLVLPRGKDRSEVQFTYSRGE